MLAMRFSQVPQFERLVHHIRPKLQRLAARYLGSWEAEDAVQDAYVRLLTARRSVRHAGRFLLVATTTVALDRLRRERRRARNDLGRPALDRFQVVAPGLEQATGTAQEALLLVAALGELPERCREALLLSRVEGATHLAIARRLGVSPKTVERDIARALRHCVERLSRETPSARV